MNFDAYELDTIFSHWTCTIALTFVQTLMMQWEDTAHLHKSRSVSKVVLFKISTIQDV